MFRIDHLRDARRYDARCAKTWAIFRGEDLVPPARVLVDDGGAARARRLRVRLPEGWTDRDALRKLRSRRVPGRAPPRAACRARPAG